MTRVNVLTAAVASVTAIYTGLLALVFAAAPAAGRQLTPVAIIPALFLGLSLFSVTVYAALFKRTLAASPLLPSAVGTQMPEYRLVTFMRWTNAGILQRAWALHAGIVGLGFGVATLPVPFFSMSGLLQLAVVVVGLLAMAWAAVATNHKRWGLKGIFDFLSSIPG